MTRVLIVDDHAIVRRGLRDLLTQELTSVVIDEAGTAAEAVDRLSREAWDLVLLDINLPGRDGLEVLQDVRRIRPAAAVIMLTSYPEEQFAVRAFKLGASAYVAKHDAPDVLTVAIRRVLSGGRFITATLAERLADSLSAPDGAPHDLLSARELQVLRLVASGLAQRDIATTLGLSEKTIGTYRARIAEKTGLSTSVEITRYVLQRGLSE